MKRLQERLARPASFEWSSEVFDLNQAINPTAAEAWQGFLASPGVAKNTLVRVFHVALASAVSERARTPIWEYWAPRHAAGMMELRHDFAT